MKVKFNVARWNPEAPANKRAWNQEYELEVGQTTTILDALIKIREQQDGTLALRCSCRASICGSCGMRVNGQARLVCKTRVEAVATNGDVINVEPLGNHKVVRDLAVDLDDFFKPLHRIEPFLKPDRTPSQGEFIAPNDAMVNLLTSMNCIMCGCCVSDCTVLEVDKRFLGPAILAKAWRFVEDPRDDAGAARLKTLNDEDGGIWDCTRCLQCVEVCPKDVAPMERIMDLRDRAIEAGNTNTSGYRHTESFNSSVKKYGRLDEARLALDSAGWFNVPRLLELAGVGFKAILRGKLPPIRPHKADERERITAIFEKSERER